MSRQTPGNDTTLPAASVQEVHYIVVIHGMGNARRNETVLGVVSRLADARCGSCWPPPDIVTLGMASGQAGQGSHEGQADPESSAPGDGPGVPWLEFAGIPQQGPQASGSPPFLGEPADPPDGRNIRFVDVHWKDLLAEEFPRIGQSPEVWLDGLLGRLRRKLKFSQNVPQWALETLGVLRETIRLVHGVLRLRAQGIDQTIFDTYLGDVQLYGEYAFTRGRAVRRFHDRMADLAIHHREAELKLARAGVISAPRQARYHVIAHSLGTVMSMEALLYAHAKRDYRDGSIQSAQALHNLPLVGYLSDTEQNAIARRAGAGADDLSRQDRAVLERLNRTLDEPWVRNVASFVTLGSPIDKFLVIWWLNYRYLCQDGWMDPELMHGQRKIRHFNYAEEQDPVGDNLDVARTAPAFDRVFEQCEDRVYVRYAVPGLAHVRYWHDQALFDHILRQSIDESAPAADVDNIEWFSRDVYRWIMMISYWAIPGGVIAVNVIAFFFAYGAESWYGAIIPSIVLLAAWLLGRYLIDLNIWWRQVLRAKQSVGAVVDVSTFAPDAVPLPLRGKIHYNPIRHQLSAIDVAAPGNGPALSALIEAIPIDPVLAQSLLRDAEQQARRSEPRLLGDLGKWIRSWVGLGYQGNDPREIRHFEESVFRGSLAAWCIGCYVLAGLLLGTYFRVWRSMVMTANPEIVAGSPIHIEQVTVIIAIFAMGAWGWRRVIRSKKQESSQGRSMLPDSDIHGRRQHKSVIGPEPALWAILLLAVGAGSIAAFLLSGRGAVTWTMGKIDCLLYGVHCPFAGVQWSIAAHQHVMTALFAGGCIAAIGAIALGYVWVRLNQIRNVLHRRRYEVVDFVTYAADAQGSATDALTASGR